MEHLKLPRDLDQPQRLLIWTIDQFVPFAFAIVVGIATEWFFTSLAVGLIGAWVVGRFRDTRADGFLLHMLYWYGFVPTKARSAINPFVRRVLPR